MKIHGPAAIALAAFLLAACENPNKSTVATDASDIVDRISITQVNVRTTAETPWPSLEQRVKARLEERLDYCAQGVLPHQMEVTIVNYKRGSSGEALLIGSGASIEGRVKLTPVASDEIVGDYYVREGFAAGGLIGVLAMADSAGGLSVRFADRVCEDIFDVKVPLQ